MGLMIVWTFLGTFNFQDVFKQPAVAADERTRSRVRRRSPARSSGRAEGGQGRRAGIGPARVAAVLFRLNQGEGFHAVADNGGTIPAASDAERKADTNYGAMPYWLLVVAGLGIFVGCVGKSAQFPLHVWLPGRDGRADAGLGPDSRGDDGRRRRLSRRPVLPAVHAEVLLFIAYTGGITLFIAATIAIVQTDIKKVLAYSTVSQLGFMMLALGVGGWVAGLFHLLTHAFFKALLFLGAGSVIYGCHHEQDMPKLGGLYPEDADHGLDHARRHAGDLGRAVLQRLVLEGRDPGAVLATAWCTRRTSCCFCCRW